MATITLTPENFESTIVDNDIVFLDFWASWCGPCRMFGPIFEEASEQHPDAVFAKVDTEAQPQLAAMFGITSIPTLVAFREKVMVFGEAGAMPAPDFEHLIETVKGLDMAEIHRKVAAAQAESDAAESDAKVSASTQ